MARDQDRIFTANFVYLVVAVFLFFIGFVMFFPVLPVYIQEHGGSRSMVGVLVGGSSLVSLMLRPFSGRWVDTQGRLRYLTLGMVLLAVSAISYDFVVAVVVFWPIRVLAGAGVSLYLTASATYVADIAPPLKRGQAMSYFGMASTMGVALGPPLGVWLMTSNGLGSVERFLERWLPGTGSEVSGGEFNFAVVFVVAFAFSLFGLALSRKLREVHTPVERPRQNLAQMVRGMFDGAAVLPGVVHSLTVVTVVSLNIFVPLYGVEAGVGNIGLFYTCYAAAVVGVRLFSGRLLDRYPRAYSIIPALGIIAAGSILIGLVSEAWVVFLGGAIVGAGHGVSQPGLQALTVDRASKERLGSAIATFNVGTDIGLGGGGFVMGLVLQFTSFTTFFIVAGLFSGLAMAVLAIATLRSTAPRGAEVAAP